MRRSATFQVRALAGMIATVEIAATAVLSIIALLVIAFAIARVVPSDPVLAVMGDNVTPELYERTRIELGLDQPLSHQFYRYVTDALHGDFGQSVRTSHPVSHDIGHTLPATLLLATSALAIGIGLGVPAGIVAAAYQHRWSRRPIALVGAIGRSTPIFWAAALCLFIFRDRLGWASAPPPDHAELLPHLMLPALLLGFFTALRLGSTTRRLVRDRASAHDDERHIVFGDVILLLIAAILSSYAVLLESAVLTETAFDWPGLGAYLAAALQRTDMNAVLGGIVTLGIASLLLVQAARLLRQRSRSRPR